LKAIKFPRRKLNIRSAQVLVQPTTFGGSWNRYDPRPPGQQPSDRGLCRARLFWHSRINLRLPTYGGVNAWEFEKRGRALKVWVAGQLVFNNIALRLKAAPDGLGLAYLPEIT
jgi:hypothetical protein